MMECVYQLEEHSNYPRGHDKKTLKTFSNEKGARYWLEREGYKHTGDRWEKEEGQHGRDMFDVWVYVKIKRYEVE